MDSSVSHQATKLLKDNVALARHYNILPWYLKEFKRIENSDCTPRTNPFQLLKICNNARRSLLIEINERFPK
jgi:hypothetical protein